VCSSPYITKMIKSRRMVSVEPATRMREIKNAHKILVGKPEGKRQFWISKLRSENNIKVNIKLN